MTWLWEVWQPIQGGATRKGCLLFRKHLEAEIETRQAKLLDQARPAIKAERKKEETKESLEELRK